MTTLAQLITPQPVSVWQQSILNGLQGVGAVTQAGATQSSGVYAGIVVQIGTGTVQAIGPASANASVVIKITTSGNVGTGYFNYSLDGGTTYNSAGPFQIPSNVNATTGAYFIPEINVTVVFTNGSYASAGSPTDSASNPSTFVVGETYSFPTSTPNFPITNWPIGGTARTLVQADAQALASLDSTISQAIAGGFLQSWIAPPAAGPPPDGWLDLKSQSDYNRARKLAVPTQGMVLLTAAATAGPYVIIPGQLIIQSSLGQLFTNAAAFTIPRGGSISALFSAVAPGSAYNSVVSYNPLFSATAVKGQTGAGTVTFGGTPYTADVVVKITTASSGSNNGQFDYSLDGGTTYSGSPQALPSSLPGTITINTSTAQFSLLFTGTNNTAGQFNLGDTYAGQAAPLPGSNVITGLVTPLPGVTAENFLNSAPPIISESSAGSIAISGIPTSEVSALFTVTLAGGVGVGKWTYTTSGSQTPSSPGPIGAVVIAGQTVTPSGTFAVGDTFSYSTSWRTQYGADTQSSPSLAAQDANQWAQLAVASPTAIYQNWALDADSEVVSASVTVDAIVQGQVDVVLVGANGGPVSAAAISAVKTYIEQRAPLCVQVSVSTVIPVTLAITAVSGTPLICSPGMLTSVQAAIAARMLALQNGTKPGGAISYSAVIDDMPVATAVNGIPGLLSVDLTNLKFAGVLLSTATGSLQLGPNMSAAITPPPATAYGVYG